MFEFEIHMYVYVATDFAGKKQYRYLTRGKVLDRAAADSISDIAKKAREDMRSWRRRQKDWRLHVTLSPYSEIEIPAYSSDALRCVALTQTDAELFWRIFSHKEAWVAALREKW